MRVMQENNTRQLFGPSDLYDFLSARKNEAKDWIYSLKDTDLAKGGEHNVAQLLSEFGFEPIVLDFDAAVVVDQGSKKINVKGDYRFWAPDDDDEYIDPHVNGHYVTFAIPYQGTAELFDYKGNHFTSQPLMGEVDGDEIRITVQDAVAFTETTLSKLQNEQFSALKHCSTGSQNEVREFNNWLQSDGLRLIQERMKTSNITHNLVEKLGFKIRKRSEQPGNVAAPVVRKTISAIDQTKRGGQIESAALDMAVYDEILTICQNMARVMELSPKAFAEMREEDLRFHFLVQLNGVFEGQATGETFNLNGKTDIIIKHAGANIFIAECKYWTGEKAYSEAIDQLLGYVSWHDTKTAIIVFNRNKDFSSVLDKLKSETIKHSNFVEELAHNSKTGICCRFRHKDDATRTFLLTVLAFNVPTN